MLNVPPLVVSRRVGHASIKTTMDLYGHLIEKMTEGMVESHLQKIQQEWA